MSNLESNPREDSSAFNYVIDKFADIRILRYAVPLFTELPLQEKMYAYCLTQAAYYGRDITYDQNYEYNLLMRTVLETCYRYADIDTEDQEFKKFEEYLKRIWFSNGIHHHYSGLKMQPEFSESFFRKLLNKTPQDKLPVNEDVSREMLTEKLHSIIFDPEVAPKKTESDPQKDLIRNSANNFYKNVTQKEAEQFYQKRSGHKDENPVQHGLNSRLIKQNESIREQTYKLNGYYSEAIEKIVEWLEEARKYTENQDQNAALEKLIEYYKTGDLETFDEFNIEWLKDTNPQIDFINGFIEVYDDPLGMKGMWEGLVFMKDIETTRNLSILSEKANWFEKHLPVAESHKKEEARGISYNVVHVIAESGDSSPATPIGINLPNSDWIRARYGSKSVSLGNIEDANLEASKDDGSLEEFFLDTQQNRLKKYNRIASKLLVGLHEVIGHGSGRTLPEVGNISETLKNYANTIEETRADLVALYFLPDDFLMEKGITHTKEIAYAAYDSYIMNGLMLQLRKIKSGENIEEAHMRNRQLICKWVYEKGSGNNVIEQKESKGKTYVVIHDHEKLRELFGTLLKEIQRIKSEGDYQAARELVENYGITVSKTLHQETLHRYAKLNIAPYTGFINPILAPYYDKSGKIADVTIQYQDSFVQQMLDFSDKYSVLSPRNDFS